MTPVRRKKIIQLLFFLSILMAVTGLVLYALRQNISLFYTPSDIALGKAALHRLIRVGGMVEKGSIVRSTEALQVSFRITDFKHSIRVQYTGILPDLFREGQGIVAEGYLSNKQNFQANQVLAKHDANYMPPEVKAALAKQVNA